MRINYSDDEEYAGQYALWQANCRRSIRGSLGQKTLRELDGGPEAGSRSRLTL